MTGAKMKEKRLQPQRRSNLMLNQFIGVVVRVHTGRILTWGIFTVLVLYALRLENGEVDR